MIRRGREIKENDSFYRTGVHEGRVLLDLTPLVKWIARVIFRKKEEKVGSEEESGRQDG